MHPWRALLWISCLLLVPPFAHAKPLSADISNTRIELHASFSGTDILVFGARNAPGDILIAVRGPVNNVTVREKQRIAGMWMYARKAKYNQLPQFVALAYTNPLKAIDAPELIGQLQLDMPSIIHASATSPTTDPVFHDAILRINERKKLYATQPEPISFFGETLFKTRIHFPDTMPSGTYQVEVYLIQDGRLISVQTMPLYALKTGFEAGVFVLSRTHPLAYGILSVLVALGCGWLAHRLFRRR